MQNAIEHLAGVGAVSDRPNPVNWTEGHVGYDEVINEREVRSVKLGYRHELADSGETEGRSGRVGELMGIPVAPRTAVDLHPR